MAVEKIKSFSRTEVCVYGKDFKLIRYKNNISLETLSDRMREKGWTYYPVKIHRLEAKSTFCLELNELIDLLACINATPHDLP